MTRFGAKCLAFVPVLVGLLPSSQSLRLEPPVVLAFCDLLVTGESGVPVTSLTAEDLLVLSDGNLQRVVSVTRSPVPVSVVVLFDVSRSHVPPDTPAEFRIVDAVQQIAASKPPEVKLRFGAFAGAIKVGPPVRNATSVRDSLLQIFAVSPREPSPLWDAVAAAMNVLSSDSGLRAIVVDSDGKASGNLVTVDDVTEAALLGNFVIGAIGGPDELLVLPDRTEVRFRPSAQLRTLTVTTGGEFTNGSSIEAVGAPNYGNRRLSGVRNQPRELGPLITAMLTRLTLRHRVTFDAPSDGRVHTLEVRPRLSGLKVLAPRQFFSPNR